MTALTAASWGPGTSLDRVFNALSDAGLNPTRRANDFKALCPAHDERTPSLHVTWRADGGAGGRVLLTCHGCHASVNEIVEALGLSVSDLFDEPPARDDQHRTGGARWRVGRSPEAREAGRERGKVGPLPRRRVVDEADHEHAFVDTETYPYVNAHAEVVQLVIRRTCSHETCNAKTFVQRWYVATGRGEKTVAKAPAGFKPVLYQLPDVLAAVAAGQPVYLLEGEKDVETADRLNLVATTNTGGGRGLTLDLLEPLRGADVRVVLDRDATGWARGLRAHELLTGIDAKVTLLLPVPLAAKADFTDHVEAGHTVDELVWTDVEDVRVLAATASVEAAYQKITDAHAEITHHLQQAEARRASAPKAADEHQRFAQRWVLETELRWQTIRDTAQVAAEVAAARDSDLARECAQLAEQLLLTAAAAAKAAHEAAGAEVPASITAGLLPSTATVPDEETSADGGADVIRFPERGGRRGGGDGGRTDLAPHIERKDFRLVNGRIVEVRTLRNGDVRFLQVINLDLRLEGREFADTSSSVEDEVVETLRQHHVVVDMQGQPVAREERKVVHLLFSYTDSRTDQRVLLRVEEERVRSGDFLDTIDVPGLEYEHTKNGRQRVIEAVRSLAKNSVDHVQYRGTGWRQDPLHGWVFVNYTGLITSTGIVSGHQLLQGVLARYALPEPTREAADLRRYFLEDSASMIDRFGARIGAVLLGQAYVTPIRRCRNSIVVHGSNGSMKTGLCALAMHHFGTAWDRTRPTTSMTGNGDTSNALKLIAHQAKDVVAFFDDVTPGGNSVAAQVRLGAWIQSLYNQETKGRANRDGETMRGGHLPQASGLFSSELLPKFGANARRALVVPLQRHELQLDDILALDRVASRLGRATLTSSMISWAARDLGRAQEIVRQAAASYGETVREAGLTPEEAEVTASLWSGWVLMTTFLVEVGALSLEEQRVWLQRVHDGLLEAVAVAQDPDAPLNAGERLRELISSALRSGAAHLTAVEDDDAPDDEGLAIRLGWRRVQTGMTDPAGGMRRRLEAKGFRAGYVNARAGEVLLDPSSLEQLIKTAAAGLSEPFTMDVGTARRALHETGVLKPQWDSSGSGRWRYTMKRTIACETSSHGGRPAQRYVTVLDLAKLLGDHDGPLDDVPGPSTGVPMPPLPDAASGAPAGGTPPNAPMATETAGNEPEPDHDLVEVTVTNTEEAEVDDSVLVTVLPTTQDCFVCGKPTRTVVDSTPVHAPCWGAVARGDDAAYQQLSADQTSEAAADAVPEEQPPLTPDARSTSTPVGQHERDTAARERMVPDQDLEPRPAQSRPVTTSRPSRSPFTGSAVVVDAAGVHLPDGQRRELPPLQHLGDLAALAYELHLGTQVVQPSRATRGHADPGVVVVSDDVAEQLGITTRGLPRDGSERGAAFAAAHEDHRALRGALQDGWHVAAQVGTNLRGWTKLWREGQSAVYVTFADLLPASLRSGGADAATISRRLGRFAEMMGTSFHVSPHATGLDLMKSLRMKSNEEFVAHTPPDPALRLGDPDLNWARMPVGEETALTYVHAYDRGGAHLAGVAGLELPVGDAVEHPQGLPFDPRLPGYWFVQIPETASDWRFPHPLFKGLRPREYDWVTTPTLALATELGYDLKVQSAWVWPQHARVLDPWYKRVRGARDASHTDDPDLAAVNRLVKEVYTRTFGMMGSRTHAEGTWQFYPERRHHIVAKARANLLRRIVGIGESSSVWPLAVKTDTVLYASDEPDPIKAWPGDPKHLGYGLGQFKVEGTGKLADQLPYLQGPGWADDGKKLITGADAPDGSE